MIPEQKAAYINGQIAMFYAEKAIMDAENIEREKNNQSPANGPTQYSDLYQKYDSIIGHNAVLLFFAE